MAVEFCRDKRQLYRNRKWQNNETSQDNVLMTKFSMLRQTFQLMTRLSKIICCDKRKLSHPDSRSDQNGVYEPGPGRETIYWDSLPVFFLRAELVPVGIQTISIITKIIYIYKRTTIEVVSIKIYTHILSPIYIYKNCTFTFTNQSAEPTCSEPLLVCWPNCMWKIADVLLCTYTD